MLDIMLKAYIHSHNVMNMKKQNSGREVNYNPN